MECGVSTNPTFSIIMPVFNIGEYVGEALESMSAQTYPDWECICIDDGSTDGSGEILETYARKDSRFRVLHQANEGPGPARNRGLESARGEWIGFLDGDDVFNPRTLELCFEISEKHPQGDMIRFGRVEYAEGGKPIWPLAGEDGIKTTDISSHIPFEAMEGGFWQRVYRKREIGNVRFQSFRPGQDRAWLGEVVTRMNVLVDMPFCGYGYRQRKGSTMHSRLTFESLASRLDWKVYTLDIWDSSAKEIHPRLFHQYVRWITEPFSHVYFLACPADLRDAIWEKWIADLAKLKDKGFLSRWARFAVTFVASKKSKFGAFALFFIPYWLKRLGGCQ